jgi:hypothetical protein
VRTCKLTLVAAVALGCGGADEPVNRSPTIAADSPEFRKAADNAARIAKEQQAAERKALGDRNLEQNRETN